MKKILILAANPIDTVRLRLSEEVREIENGLQRSQHRDQFVIKQQWATRTQDIRRAMLDVTPNIVHFCGHGEGEAGLVFENKEGEAQFISTDALAGFFELFADTVACVVLNACYSEAQAQAIARHIDYVVGMSQGIGDQTAIEFAVAFYDTLGAGRTVDFAYKLACNAIQMAGIDEHLIPVMIKRDVHEGSDVQTKKAFVPGYTYKYDILVSYAPVDDKPLYGAKEGWVTTFITQLKTQLASKLGREDAYSLWSAHQMPGNIPMSEMLNILHNSAMLIVVLSPGYLASEWCQRQKNDFLSMLKDRIRAGSRVFVVERDRLEAEERPPEFQDLRGYQFWVVDREGRPPRTLGEPTPQRDEELYYERLNDLCYDLAQELRRLKASATSSG